MMRKKRCHYVLDSRTAEMVRRVEARRKASGVRRFATTTRSAVVADAVALLHELQREGLSSYPEDGRARGLVVYRPPVEEDWRLRGERVICNYTLSPETLVQLAGVERSVWESTGKVSRSLLIRAAVGYLYLREVERVAVVNPDDAHATGKLEISDEITEEPYQFHGRGPGVRLRDRDPRGGGREAEAAPG